MRIPEGTDVVVIGGGLAGTDAAWSAAREGARVALFEMRPVRSTPAHKSIDRSIVFEASRYGKGQEEGGAGGYLNCPLSEEEYHRFREAVLQAELVPMHDFEPLKLFEGCLPVEEMARRGELTMAFGPMKP